MILTIKQPPQQALVLLHEEQQIYCLLVIINYVCDILTRHFLLLVDRPAVYRNALLTSHLGIVLPFSSNLLKSQQLCHIFCSHRPISATLLCCCYIGCELQNSKYIYKPSTVCSSSSIFLTIFIVVFPF